MKRKQRIVSVSLALTILLSILFQSIHSYEHVVQQVSEQQCHHRYDKKQGGITHQHSNYDLCYVCHFSFGNYIVSATFSFQFNVFQKKSHYFFPFSQRLILFSGSSYFLRGPPAVMPSLI